MSVWVMLATALPIVVLAGIVLMAWDRVFDGPDGERYRKRLMQGPFVPLSTVEIEEDERRRKDKSAGA